MSRAFELLEMMTPIFGTYVAEYGPTPFSNELALLAAAERHIALAAATGTAETNEDLAQCEASQSDPAKQGNARKEGL